MREIKNEEIVDEPANAIQESTMGLDIPDSKIDVSDKKNEPLFSSLAEGARSFKDRFLGAVTVCSSTFSGLKSEPSPEIKKSDLQEQLLGTKHVVLALRMENEVLSQANEATAAQIAALDAEIAIKRREASAQALEATEKMLKSPECQRRIQQECAASRDALVKLADSEGDSTDYVAGKDPSTKELERRAMEIEENTVVFMEQKKAQLKEADLLLAQGRQTAPSHLSIWTAKTSESVTVSGALSMDKETHALHSDGQLTVSEQTSNGIQTDRGNFRCGNG